MIKRDGVNGTFMPVDENISEADFLAKLPKELDAVVIGGAIRMTAGEPSMSLSLSHLALDKQSSYAPWELLSLVCCGNLTCAALQI